MIEANLKRGMLDSYKMYKDFMQNGELSDFDKEYFKSILKWLKKEGYTLHEEDEVLLNED